jgi:hypothetical protein
MDETCMDLTRIAEGMDVCDVGGEKIGTVAAVHSYAPVAAGGGRVVDQPSFVEVKTGFLGLGKHLYVPITAIQDVTEGCVFLHQRRDAVEHDHPGWRERPPALDRPT